MRLRLVPRDRFPVRWADVGLTAGSLVAALGVGAVVLAIAGVDPLAA